MTERKESLLEECELALSAALHELSMRDVEHAADCWLNKRSSALGAEGCDCGVLLVEGQVRDLLTRLRPIMEARRSGRTVPVEVWVGHDGECFGATSANDERDALEAMTDFFDLNRDRIQLTRATIYAALPEPQRVHEGGEGE